MIRMAVALFAGVLISGIASAAEEIYNLSDGRSVSESELAELFEQENFSQLESIIEDIREHDIRISQGRWGLEQVYNHVRGKKYWRLKERDLEGAFRAKIEAWAEAYPDSATWRILLAKALLGIGWEYRRTGFANTVTEEGWESLHRYMHEALELLAAAERQPNPDPELYVEALEVVLTIGGTVNAYMDAQKLNAFGYEPGANNEPLEALIFDRGADMEPLYYPLYFKRARSLMRRWGGGPGDLERFAAEAAERTASLEGKGMYARIFGNVVYQWGAPRIHLYYNFDGDEVQRGFSDLAGRYNNPKHWRHYECYAACFFQDRERAKELFDELGEYYPRIWGSKTRYNRWRAWANGESPYPHTGLEAAMQDQFMPAFKALLEQGADPTIKNEFNQDMLYRALQWHRWEYVDLLLDWGMDPLKTDGRFRIVYDGSLEELNYLLKRGLDATARLEDGSTLLHFCADRGQASVARRLIELGIDPNTYSEKGATPLLHAAARGDKQMVQTLLDAGADPTLTSDTGLSALRIARGRGHPEVADLIRKHIENAERAKDAVPNVLPD